MKHPQICVDLAECSDVITRKAAFSARGVRPKPCRSLGGKKISIRNWENSKSLKSCHSIGNAWRWSNSPNYAFYFKGALVYKYLKQDLDLVQCLEFFIMILYYLKQELDVVPYLDFGILCPQDFRNSWRRPVAGIFYCIPYSAFRSGIQPLKSKIQ